MNTKERETMRRLISAAATVSNRAHAGIADGSDYSELCAATEAAKPLLDAPDVISEGVAATLGEIQTTAYGAENTTNENKRLAMLQRIFSLTYRAGAVLNPLHGAHERVLSEWQRGEVLKGATI